ncbi:MAG: DUF86 domain-containing protein [Firmicutes bacterium]|nr:DUF86 domain-containing protein [Alicyclobacillaceae bacterium]MCL6498360.1 DUF86 domain-containing protein [Bacillota bacterium]
MTSRRDDRIPIEDMIRACQMVIEYTGSLTDEEFFRQRLVQDAVLYELAILGEAANAVSRPVRDQHPEIPWAAIANMRHHVVQGYGDVDLDIVWETARQDVPNLLAQLQAIGNV